MRRIGHDGRARASPIDPGGSPIRTASALPATPQQTEDTPVVRAGVESDASPGAGGNPARLFGTATTFSSAPSSSQATWHAGTSESSLLTSKRLARSKSRAEAVRTPSRATLSTPFLGMSVTDRSCMVYSLPWLSKSTAVKQQRLIQRQSRLVVVTYLCGVVISTILFGYLLFSEKAEPNASPNAAAGLAPYDLYMVPAVLVPLMLILRMTMFLLIFFFGCSRPIFLLLFRSFQTWFLLFQAVLISISMRMHKLTVIPHPDSPGIPWQNVLAGPGVDRSWDAAQVFFVIFPLLISSETLLADAAMPRYSTALLSAGGITGALYLFFVIISGGQIGYFSHTSLVTISIGSASLDWSPRASIIGACFINVVFFFKILIDQVRTNFTSSGILLLPYDLVVTNPHLPGRKRKGKDAPSRGKKSSGRRGCLSFLFSSSSRRVRPSSNADAPKGVLSEKKENEQ
jgi:hypothetical protein